MYTVTLILCFGLKDVKSKTEEKGSFKEATPGKKLSFGDTESSFKEVTPRRKLTFGETESTRYIE